jgi:sugar lactone lactonase YvrE
MHNETVASPQVTSGNSRRPGMMTPVRRRGAVLTVVLGFVSWAAFVAPMPGWASGSGVAPTVHTVVGPGTLASPSGLALDSAGDLFIADTGHCRIVVVASHSGRSYGVTLQRGRAMTVAGGHCGPGSMEHPTGVAVDPRGDVYFSEANEQRVQLIQPSSGAVSTVAGTGQAGSGGDGGVATAGQLHEPTGVAVDRRGDLFIADTANCRIEAVPAVSGELLGQSVVRNHIYTVAGTGVCGSAGQGGPLRGAELFDPVAVATDVAGGLLVADAGDQSVLLAPAVSGTYYGTTVGAGDLGVIVGGTGSYGPYIADGLSATGAGAELNDPRGLVLTPNGTLVVTDGFMHVIRFVPAQSGTEFGRSVTGGDLYTLAGALPESTSVAAGDGTRWVLTAMGVPAGVAVTSSGAILYGDTAKDLIRSIG